MDSSIKSLSILAIAKQNQRIDIDGIMGWKGVVDLGSKIKDYLLPNMVLWGNSSIVQCCVSEQHQWQILHESFANENQVQCQY